jgi:hypothetical protein
MTGLVLVRRGNPAGVGRPGSSNGRMI